MVFAHGPLDKVTRIRVDEKTVWEGLSTGGSIYVDSPNAFGGGPPGGEGGIQGLVDVEMGGTSQPINSYLASKLGAVIPAFRGVTALVLRQCYIGNTPYLKTWGLTATRIGGKDLTSATATIVSVEGHEDMNPAHIVYECITNTSWGMGSDSSIIDHLSFLTVAQKLYDEKFGLSLLWDGSKAINEFLTDIMSHIDGVLYVDRVTGKFTIKLIRDDYSFDDLEIFDESSIVGVTDFTKPLISDLTSQVTVRFWDSQTFANSSTTVQDIALSRQQGTTIGISKDYPGITSATLASKVAMRDINTVATPLTACTIEITPSAGDSLTIGSVFRMQWPRLGVADMAVRVVKISYGTETSPNIVADVVQDVFKLGDVTYAPAPPTEWVPPVSEPVASPHRLFMSAPYREVVERVGSNLVDSLEPDAEFLLSAPIKPSSDAIEAEWWNDNGTGTIKYQGSADFTPYIILEDNLDYLDEQISYVSGQDMSMVEVGDIADINGELVVVKAVDSVVKTLTIGRGCCDTVPQKHSAGSYIMFIDQFAVGGEYEYVAGDVVKTKFLTKTLSGVLAYNLAPEDSYTLVKRFDTPYPPGNVKIADEYYPAVVESDFVITWANRNRLLMQDNVYEFVSGDLGLETGVTYDITVFDITNNQTIVSETGVTGNSYQYAFNGAPVDIRITMVAKRDGVSSFTSYVHETYSVDILAVTTQPSNAVVAEGADAVFRSNASGWGVANDTVEWEEYDGVDWQPIVGVDTKDLTINDTTIEDDGRQFRATYFRDIDAKSAYTVPAFLYIFTGGQPLPTYWTESPLINGNAATLDLTGWTVLANTPVAQGSPTYFMGGASSTSAMIQHIDLQPTYGDTLAGEQVRMRAEWLHGSYSKYDQVTLNIISYSKTGDEISRTANPQQVLPSWQTRQIEHDLPAGTFKVGILLEWQRKSGTNSDGYITDIVVNHRKALTDIVLPDAFLNPPLDLSGGWNYTNIYPATSFKNSETVYPLYGSTLLASEHVASANAYYDIDVTVLAEQIDAGGIEFGMIFGITKTYNSTGDTINIAYIYLDDTDTEISRDETGGLEPTTGTGQNDFKEWNVTHPLPVGTRKLRVNGDWVRPTGTYQDTQLHIQSASFGWVDGYEPPV